MFDKVLKRGELEEWGEVNKQQVNINSSNTDGSVTLWGVANLDPRGMVGRIYVGDHLTLLHTKYLSS